MNWAPQRITVTIITNIFFTPKNQSCPLGDDSVPAEDM